MEDKRFHELCVTSLVSASQLAYVEEAASTHFFLQCFHEFFQYAIRKRETVLLQEELNVLKRYVDFQAMRYPGRFALRINAGEAVNDTFLSPMNLIDQFDAFLMDLLMRDERFFEISLTVSTDGTYVEMSVENGGIQERKRVCLFE